MTDIDENKSPGTDGFSSAFFHTRWDRIRGNVVQAVNQFFTTGFLLKEWNQTLLVLILELYPPEEVNHLRPISLCNTIYKCAAKCIVDRMKHSSSQSHFRLSEGFVSGYHMDENILVSNELLHVINKQRGQHRHLAALKLYMNKAYDWVSWLFILKF